MPSGTCSGSTCRKVWPTSSLDVNPVVELAPAFAYDHAKSMISPPPSRIAVKTETSGSTGVLRSGFSFTARSAWAEVLCDIITSRKADRRCYCVNRPHREAERGPKVPAFWQISDGLDDFHAENRLIYGFSPLGV